MKKAEVDAFETLAGQMQGLYEEMQSLSKKRPTDAVNRFKLNLINGLLSRANGVLGDTRKPFADFSAFSEDDLPLNSDVLVVVAQYLSCLEKMRADNITRDPFEEWYWIIDGKQSRVKTCPPRKLTR